VPPHHWLPLKQSSCSERKRKLQDKLGNRAVKRVWSGRDCCYALVVGPIDAVPRDWYCDGKKPIKVVDDDDLDDGEA
jgi:hypothetical protein